MSSFGASPFRPKGTGVVFGADRRAKGDYMSVPGYFNVVCPFCQGELNLDGTCVLCSHQSPQFKDKPSLPEMPK